VNRTNWIGTLNVTYSTGPAPGAVISMSNLMNATITPIWDAIGIINGTNSDETIVIGNHRDAWIVGGAADPNSGSAVLVELSKAFGKLLKTGWKPKRNIVLASWDAEEYGLVGSTEWVEEFIDPWLTNTAVSYLNMDVGCAGPHPLISASPELHTIALDVMKKILFPKEGAMNQTMYDIWYAENSGQVGVLGSGSDYTAFLHNGIGCIDMGSGNGPNDPVYHYHSNYDSYHWMANFGDPGFHVHTAMGQYLTLLAYHLASDDLIPFDLPNYGKQLDAYFSILRKSLASANVSSVDLSALSDAISYFKDKATEVQNLEKLAVMRGDSALLSVVNKKYRDFQRGFVSQGGLPNREFYKHVVFAPGIDTGYAATTYPGITEAVVQYKNLTMAVDWVRKTAEGIRRAADIIKT
jgi:N-acetylated-alpha-linked acidic dipeptidase